MALDDRLDLYEVKAQFERFTEWLFTQENVEIVRRVNVAFNDRAAGR